MTVPNRNPQDNPDPEQERRLQARQETDFARGLREDHPPFAYEGPDSQRQTLAPGLPPQPTETQLVPEAPPAAPEPEPAPAPKKAARKSSRKSS